MQFFRLTHPDYKADQAHDKTNPVKISTGICLPGIICSECGQTWAGSRRLYLPVSDPSLRARLRPAPLREAEWMALAQDVRKALNLPEDFLLWPGDDLGTPIAELKSEKIYHFLHPFPGQLIVRVSVVDALTQAGLTGFRPLRLQVRWSAKKREQSADPPILYELVITGAAWRMESNLERITVCKHCGRTEFPRWTPIDESRWDGSDLFNIDQNPNMVFVTERACELFAEHHFTNYVCAPVP